MIHLDEPSRHTNKQSHKIWMDHLDKLYKWIIWMKMTYGGILTPGGILKAYPTWHCS